MLSSLPLYKSVVVGFDSYADLDAVRQLAQGPFVQRAWLKGSTPSSVQLIGGGVVKSLRPFHKHPDEASFMAMLEECAAQGVHRPSSYSDVFHQKFYSPPIPRSVNYFFEEHFAGAWQEARELGKVTGHLFKYDINSAYLWSGAQGLPLPASFYYTENLKHRDALFLVEIVPRIGAPYPFHSHRYVNVQPDDIDLYGLDVVEVYAGVGWKRWMDGDEILRVVERFSFAKQIGKGYWGKWAMRSPLKCRSYRDGAVSKEWGLRNPTCNFVWAQVIINRVKRRVYEADPSPVHVFVDSIITRKPMHTSHALGGWRADGEYPNGLTFLGPGWYGVPGSPFLKHVGVPDGGDVPDMPFRKRSKKPLRIDQSKLRALGLRVVR